MLADRIADFLFKGGNITDEEKEIICFGLESLEGNLLGIGLTLIVGMCFRQVREAILLWWPLFPLRKNAGGYHAKTKTKCMLISLIILIIAFMFFSAFECTVIFCVVCVMITGCVIWILSPVDNPSKELDVVEHKVYRRRTRLVLVVEGSILLLALYFQLDFVTKSIVIAYFIVSVSLLMGLISNKSKQISVHKI